MNNEACKGYVLMVCERIKLDKRTIKRIVSLLNSKFDEVTEYEAEEHYYREYDY